MKAILILVALLVSFGVVNETPKDMPVVDSATASKDDFVTSVDMSTSLALGRLRPVSTKYVTTDSTYILPIIGQFYDTLLMTKCSVGNAEDGSSRCIPVASSIGYYFSDSLCTKTIALSNCGIPEYAFDFSNGVPACGMGYPIYKIGPKIGFIPIYTSIAGSPCTIQNLPGYSAYQVLNRLLPTDMVAVQTSSVW